MKRGISLIAVLMFMLAATTASIVVFKWVGSENFSSGARLKASEAYQASESGIDNVRSWMENKGADVGALVTQYYNINPPSSNTNPKLKSLRIFNNESVGGKEQKFSAYLIGIDTTSKPVLRFKVLVEGSARDSSKVSQTAIFSTDGLYKIFIPAEIQKQKAPAEVNAYFGSGMEFKGSKRFSSATINGNWTGNPPKIDKDFIVTGNLIASAKGVEIGKNACIGGVYDPNNNDVKIGGGLYIGSSPNFVGNAGSYQNVYCEGDLKFGQSGVGEMINGNLTINGRMFGFNGNRRYRINGNLVLGDTVATATSTANIDFSATPNDGSLVVCDSVWTTNPAGVRVTQQTQGAKINFNYGRGSAEGCPNKPNAALFFKDAARTSPTGEEYKTLPTNPLGYFRSKTNNNTPADTNKPIGADSIKIYCMNIFTPTPGNTGCQSSKYKVNDPIATTLDSIKKFLSTNASKSTETSGSFKCLNNTATTIRTQGNINTDNSGIYITNVLNDCYGKLKSKPNLLYGGNDGYLIVKLNQARDYSFNSNLKALDGKFIFIYEEQQNSNVLILPTTSTSKVMIFFEKGVNSEMKSSGCISDGGGGNYKYNYFIYSQGDINKANEWNPNCPLEGNIFFPSGTCKRLVEVDNNFSLESNAELVDDLMDMGILCKRRNGTGDYCTPDEIKETKDGETNEDAKPINPEIRDNNWIPIAARLPIKLESKEISKEKAPALAPADTLGKSILIMPRVIYLAPNQINSQLDLRKYYEPLYLNGATKTPDIPAPTCGISNFSEKKRYTCSFQGRTDVSNFHVIIDPSNDVISTPAVTARCEWGGRDRVMFVGQSKPSDPTITCSPGESDVTWEGLPPSPLTKGTNNGRFTPIPKNVTCDGQAPTNSINISCGTLTVKTKPTISCAGKTEQSVTLPEIPKITLNDPDAVCPSGLTNIIWSVNRGSTTLSDPTWDKLFYTSGNYSSYRVSGICGDYGALDASCTPGSATVSVSGGGIKDCEYQTGWCGGQEFSSVFPGTSNKPVQGDCVFIGDFTTITTASERSGGGTVLINGISCSGNATTCATITNIKNKKDGGYYVYVQSGGISAGPGGNDGWSVTTAAKPNCVAVNSSGGTSTITCAFTKNSYDVNESIDAPTITCSNNGSLNKSSMSFSFTGISPNSPSEWENGLSTKYTTAGTSTVKVTGAKCNNTTVADATCTPSPLNIAAAACTPLTLNNGIYKISGAAVDACFSLPCIGNLQAGYYGSSDKKINVSGCGDFTITKSGNSNVTYYPICTTNGNIQVTLKSEISSSANISLKCDNSRPEVTCNLGGGTHNIGAAINRPTVSCGTGFSASSMSFSGDVPDKDNGWNSGGGGTGTYKTSGTKSGITLSSVNCAATASTATYTETNISCTNPFSINEVTCSISGTHTTGTSGCVSVDIPTVNNCPSAENLTFLVGTNSPVGGSDNGPGWSNVAASNNPKGQFCSERNKTGNEDAGRVWMTTANCNNVDATIPNGKKLCGYITILKSSSSVASSSSRASSSSAAVSSSSAGGGGTLALACNNTTEITSGTTYTISCTNPSSKIVCKITACSGQSGAGFNWTYGSSSGQTTVCDSNYDISNNCTNGTSLTITKKTTNGTISCRNSNYFDYCN